jgi:hypothetical protein
MSADGSQDNAAVSGPGEACRVSSIAREMAAFDALPPEVRAVLRNAAWNWSSQDILARWHRVAVHYGEAAATRAAVQAIRAAEPPGLGVRRR